MFKFEDPSDLDTDWYLGDRKKCSERIPKELLQKMSNFHLIGIQYLHENFARKRHGVILNEDEHMNMSLQVCTFLRALQDKITIQSPVIVICPENSLCIWHYHFSEVGLEPQIITSEDIIFDVSKIYLLSFESMKLFDKLKHLDFFCAVIDDFDIIATRQAVRKISGTYRIGLTKRNFYTNPDQKLRWTMLNWASPGCVGKLKDFYHIDHLHSLALADNYRFWWVRLTFKYCASFEQPNDDEIQDYQEKLIQWGVKCGIPTNFNLKRSKPKKKLRANEVKSKKQSVKPPGSHRIRQNRKSKIKNFHYKDDLSSSDEDNEPESKKHKAEETIETGESASTSRLQLEETPNNMEEVTEKCVTPVLKQRANEEDNEIESIKQNTTKADRDNTIVSRENVNEDNTSEDIIKATFDSDSLNSSKIGKSNLSDDEDPILSFITSREPEQVETNRNSDGDVKTILQSSDTESDFLADFVKNKDTAKRFYASQQISEILDNLSDEDLMKCGNVSDDDDFFSELILGKTK